METPIVAIFAVKMKELLLNVKLHLYYSHQHILIMLMRGYTEKILISVNAIDMYILVNNFQAQ